MKSKIELESMFDNAQTMHLQEFINYYTPDTPNTGSDTEESKATKALLFFNETLETLIGVSKALSRMIDKYNPDDIEAEWIGEANEVIIKVTGKSLSQN